MPNRDRDSLWKLILDDVIGDGCFALYNLAFRRFSTPNIDLSLNVLSIGTDKHFEFHVFVPSLLSATIAARTASTRRSLMGTDWTKTAEQSCMRSTACFSSFVPTSSIICLQHREFAVLLFFIPPAQVRTCRHCAGGLRDQHDA